MQGLFSSLADKAQSAINASPLGRSSQSADGSAQSPGILKSHAFESIHHQLRTFQQQYSSSVTPAQKIVTSQKGVALDLDNLGRDVHAQSKELYTWGQTENDDIKDVTDRLAWMNYILGSLSATLAQQIDASRAPFKALRDAETSLSGRRNIRGGLQNQIARIEHDQQRGMEHKLAELKRQLRKAEEDDEPLEKEVELLKRKAVRDSERQKWEAVREYGEKLALVAQAASSALPALPDIPPSKVQPYTGGQLTASVRTTLQQALDSYRVGDTTLYFRELSAADLGRSDTRSFGETHAKELASIGTAEPHTMSNIPVTPPTTTHDTPPQAPSHTANITSPLAPTPTTNTPAVAPKASTPPQGAASPPLNPATLNQAPAPIPYKAGSPPSAVVAPNPSEPSIKVPTVTPTVAETGLPKSAGPDGPGPASGSLLDLKQPSPIAPIPVATQGSALAITVPPGYAAGVTSAPESAEDEKKRLAREERERFLREGGQSGDPLSSVAEHPKFESAEEEKKRLEREDRERLLAAGGSSNPNPDPDAKEPPPDDGELPPYQEF
ncbi:Eisosome component PIL1-domain-containing protein [Lenzites betulinus]|nr:Eisosome component PIL1-domain-containing protein [Lenzites betulinus]